MAAPIVDHRYEVLIVGDGPAGRALANALNRRGADVGLIGGNAPWTATYGVWLDELADTEIATVEKGGVRSLVSTVAETVRLATTTDRTIDRPYAIIDNEAFRRTLSDGVDHVVGAVATAQVVGVDWVVHGLRDGDAAQWSARMVIDATGWPSRLNTDEDPPPAAWQTAWGVVLPEPPDGPIGSPTVMDWSPPGGIDHDIPTFAYAFPVEDGWMVEETVLASRAVEPPERLRPVLARRLGWSVDELDRHSLRTERVCIPMGAPVPSVIAGDDTPTPVPYGAAASLAHPATGYQLMSALTLAGSVADAILDALAATPRRDAAIAVFNSIWTPSRRRTRALHEFGLDVLLRLDADGLRDFFATFFALDADTWPPQMRIDSPPTAIGAIMLRMFAAAPWRLRRQLVGGDLRLALPAISPTSLRARRRPGVSRPILAR